MGRVESPVLGCDAEFSGAVGEENGGESLGY